MHSFIADWQLRKKMKFIYMFNSEKILNKVVKKVLQFMNEICYKILP